MNMLVSSVHPAQAGVQVALVHTLLDFGAAVDGAGTNGWWTPLMTALAFDYLDAAKALVQRGARIDSLAVAAGLGRVAEVRNQLGLATAADRRRALVLAALHGRAEIVALLLQAGEDPNRFNPQGMHAHSTPLHQAAWSGDVATVRVLVEYRARVDVRDTGHHRTPLQWAEHGGRAEVVRYLRTLTAANGD